MTFILQIYEEILNYARIFVNKVSFYDTFLDIVINVTCFITDIYDVMILYLIYMKYFAFISPLFATEHAFVCYGAVLCMIWSSAP